MAEITTTPLTPQTWDDFVALAELPGSAILRSCWCVAYRSCDVRLNPDQHAANKARMRRLVERDLSPGLLAYADGRAVGWITLGPREDFERLARSRVMKPVDEKAVWSVVCTFVASRHRGQGVQRRLLRDAIDFARDQGATLLEAYAVDKAERSASSEMWFGSRSLYEKAGFREVERRSATRVVMRRGIRPRRSP